MSRRSRYVTAVPGRAPQRTLVGGVLSTCFLFLGWLRLDRAADGWMLLGPADQAQRIWMVVFGSFAATFGVSALAMLTSGLGREDIGLMLPMPLDHVERWRWRWLIGRVLGIHGVASLPALLFGIAIAARFDVWWSVVLVLWTASGVLLGSLLPLVVASIGLTRWRSTLALAGLLTLAGGLILAARTGVLNTLHPVAMIPDAVAILVLGWWIGARRLGRWYVSVAQHVYHVPARSRSWIGPLAEPVIQVARRRATPVAAIVAKDARLQARDPLILVRILLIAAAIPAFDVIVNRFVPDMVSSVQAAAMLALVAGMYGYMEITLTPLGAEGNRIAMTFCSPISGRDLLVAKSLTAILPALTTMFVTWMLLIGVRIGVSSGVVAMVCTTAAAVAGTGLIVTALSARDIDLDATVEGSVQGLIQEHLPNRAWRIVAMTSVIVICIATGATIWIVPPGPALIGIVIAMMVVAAVALRDAGRVLGSRYPAMRDVLAR